MAIKSGESLKMLLSFGPVFPNARIFFPRKLSKIHGKFCMNEQLVVFLIVKSGKGLLLHESAVVYPLYARVSFIF